MQLAKKMIMLQFHFMHKEHSTSPSLPRKLFRTKSSPLHVLFQISEEEAQRDIVSVYAQASDT